MMNMNRKLAVLAGLGAAAVGLFAGDAKAWDHRYSRGCGTRYVYTRHAPVYDRVYVDAPVVYERPVYVYEPVYRPYSYVSYGYDRPVYARTYYSRPSSGFSVSYGHGHHGRHGHHTSFGFGYGGGGYGGHFSYRR